MKKLKITGGNTLSGTINISGAKNSVVALIPAAILCDEEVVINNVPNITDVTSLESIMNFLDCEIQREETKIVITNENLKNKEIPHDISSKLRASYYFMGALLGKFKYAEIYFPGGCSIGKRPINIHLDGFEKLGATIVYKDEKFIIQADELIGADINLEFPSCGATINLMLAAVKAKGNTKIINAAKEPEIVNVAQMLKKMGAKINGEGTGTIEIQGVEYLKSCEIDVIPDRIEAGTYLIVGALAGKNLIINNVVPEHFESLTNLLKKSGCDIKVETNSLTISTKETLKPIDVITEVYPGFPTDLQQPLVPFLTKCDGDSGIVETIYENRFLNIEHINNMGANIDINDNKIIIHGKTDLKGNEVVATDLRGGASVVLAALISEGTTFISQIDHILRGYDNIVEKLSSIGADINLIEDLL